MIRALTKYHQYVPVRNKEVAPVILFGDCATVEWGLTAKAARLDGGTPSARLDGLEPFVQEWHARKVDYSVS